MGVGALFKDFSGWTSAHGIPQIGGARNWPVRIIWTILFLIAFGMFVYQLSIIITSYYQYGVIVSTAMTDYMDAIIEQSVPDPDRYDFNIRECGKMALTETLRDECMDNYKKNSLEVQVYFNRLTHMLLVENEAYGVIDVIMNCGGQVGLWMGFSSITLVELVGLIIIIFLYCCAKFSGPRKVSPEDLHAKDLDDIDKMLDDAGADENGEVKLGEGDKVDPYAAVDNGDNVPPPAAT